MTEWIPIGEQEPPGGSVVLATIVVGNWHREIWTLDVAYDGDAASGRASMFYRNLGWRTITGLYRLVAWMYRPEPYAGDGTMRSEPQPTRQIRRGGG